MSFHAGAGAERIRQAARSVVGNFGVPECRQQEQQAGVGIGGAAARQRIVCGCHELGPGQARSHEVPVVPGEKLGLCPVGVVEEVVGAGVVRESAVDDVKTMLNGEWNSERRPLGPLPQSPLEVAGRVVVRAKQQLFGLLAPDTRVMVPQSEQGLVQESGLVREGPPS
ncbi:hypothetical protein OHB05_37660 [Streptomyces sp. NBC_00638]|uniref:hypothetical protein n=1 Tax=unclassified Streptomyces TaxID=2593676 RepID=UPI00224D32BA|nr:hypothetical protein [Streptomyces sp. NBC_00638]MCX5008301.1 hypothetical protein [Streptomyces sp. NBC_00638]